MPALQAGQIYFGGRNVVAGCHIPSAVMVSGLDHCPFRSGQPNSSPGRELRQLPKCSRIWAEDDGGGGYPFCREKKRPSLRSGKEGQSEKEHSVKG